MAIAVLYPRFDHPAIEERYASWQTQMRLRHGADLTKTVFYEAGEYAADIAAELSEPHVLVVTDPLVVPSLQTGTRLRVALESGTADAAVPVTNEARHPRQQRNPSTAYLTLGELQSVFEQIERESPSISTVTWDESDPALYLCRTELLRKVREPLPRVLRGRTVAIDASTYVHVWGTLRGQVRDDLLPYIPAEARNVLELGCGEGGLAALIKQRQKCRVVGIEIDREAAAIAKKRGYDDVYTGDVRHIIELLNDRYDCIVASELVEHVDDPWSMLAELRDVAARDGRLVISIPNIANASVIADLLNGRFDYAYIGLLSVGHLRFFTRQSIEELLDIAGWSVETVAPQRAAVTPAGVDLLAAAARSGLQVAGDELLATGYYVVARNESR